MTILLNPPCHICGAPTEGGWITMDWRSAGTHAGCIVMAYFCRCSVFPVRIGSHTCAKGTP